LLAGLIDNMLALEDPVDAPTLSQTSEAGAQDPAEVAARPDLGLSIPDPHNGSERVLKERRISDTNRCPV
jgi:hypothetical protein